jgi:hypothetical protein
LYQVDVLIIPNYPIKPVWHCCQTRQYRNACEFSFGKVGGMHK